MTIGNNADDPLTCAGCGAANLHHLRVETFWRDEDANHGTHVLSSHGTTTVDGNLQGNPSSRRSGLAVHFQREQCSHISVLTIEQHKGSTYVVMV